MDGQVDLFDLLDVDPRDAPPKFQGFPTAAVSLIPDMPLTCRGCGETSPNQFLANLNHRIHGADTDRAGFWVCSGMNLRRNHVHYAIQQVVAETPMPCCYTKHSLHGRTVNKPTRAQLVDHAREYLAAAQTKWTIHPDELTATVMGYLIQYGIPISDIYPEIKE